MATDVSICSNALLMLGAKSINSLVESSDGNADRVRLAANLWPAVRDQLLRDHPWNCAIKRDVLAPDGTAPAFDWSARFRLPSDFLRLLSVGEDGAEEPYKLDAGFILADTDALAIRYVFRNDDVGSWDAGMVQVATLRMAAAMAYAVTQSASLADAMEQKAERAFKRAKSVDGQEDMAEMVGDPRQTRSRY